MDTEFSWTGAPAEEEGIPSAWLNYKQWLFPGKFLCVHSQSSTSAGHCGQEGLGSASPRAAAQTGRALMGVPGQSTAQSKPCIPPGLVLQMHQHLGTRHIAVVILTLNGEQALQVKV